MDFIILFWLLVGIVFYTYVGYGIVLYGLIKWKRWRNKGQIKEGKDWESDYWPEVTVLIAAYNEENFIQEKIENTFQLAYPASKVYYLFVTDGSDDQTAEIVSQYSQIQHYHTPERKGKIAAVNRVMQYVKTPYVVFSDANTLLNREALKHIVRHYQDERVGAVSGEKRVMVQEKDSASASGESFYWRYESKLKQWDSELYSVVGAAGELFSIRTHLHEHISTDTLIEDFFLTMRIAQKGYKVAYEPQAYAVETASASVAEERKRKIRISAGGFQAIVRLKSLLNPFKFGWLSFQYISHRVLRWTLAPLALLLLIPINGMLAWMYGGIYQFFLVCQFLFYTSAFLGWKLEQRNTRFKLLYIPYYFCMMNTSVFQGLIRYLRGSQSVIWERAERKIYDSTS